MALKLKGLDPVSGSTLDDQDFKPVSPQGDSSVVRPIDPTDGSSTGDVLRRRFANDPIPHGKVLDLLKKAREREDGRFKSAGRLKRSLVIRAYLTVSNGTNAKTLQAINLEKEA